SAVTGLAAVFATSLEASDGLQLADDGIPADQKLEQEQLRERVRKAIERPPDKEKTRVKAYYFQAKAVAKAGAEVGQWKSWASRLHARAVERLKDYLAEDEDEFSSSQPKRKPHGSTSNDSDNFDEPARPAKSPGANPAAQARGIKI